LELRGLPIGTVVGKVGQPGVVNAVELISSGRVQLVVNSPRGRGARGDGVRIRAAAFLHHVPCLRIVVAARAAAAGIGGWRRPGMSVVSLQEVHGELEYRSNAQPHWP
jgi:carbamoyl-phosphate synthase large subunit